MSDTFISELIDQLSNGELSRRDFIKRAVGAGVSGSTLAAALSSHGSATQSSTRRAVNSRAQADQGKLAGTDDLSDQS